MERPRSVARLRYNAGSVESPTGDLQCSAATQRRRASWAREPTFFAAPAKGDGVSVGRRVTDAGQASSLLAADGDSQ